MRQLHILPVLLLSLTLIFCNRGPYGEANRAYRKQAKSYAKQIQKKPSDSLHTAAGWVGTTNFNMRKPNFVIIHHTAQNSCEQTLTTFTTERTQVSAHYVICEDGTVHHMLNDYLRAWHGGVGRWGNTTDMNSASIGIELDNNGFEQFPEEQINSLLHVLASLKKSFSIPAANFIGHSDLAPTRKVDPNIHFPWKRLADSGYGLWWTDTTGMVVPDDFHPLQALRIIGYDIKDASAAIGAFKRKYVQVEGKELYKADRKILYSLYQRFL